LISHFFVVLDNQHFNTDIFTVLYRGEGLGLNATKGLAALPMPILAVG